MSECKYKGVEYLEKKNKYRAFIKVEGRKKIIGTFKTEYEASLAYDMYMVKIFGNATVNHEVVKKMLNKD